MTDAAQGAWSALLTAAGNPESAERFWSRVRSRSPELSALTDRAPMLGTLAGLAAGTDDAAGQAAARTVLGRWIHRHRLRSEQLRILGAAASHLLCDDTTDDAAALHRLTAELMRAAWRIGDGPAWWAAQLVRHERPAEGIAVLTVRPDRPLPFRPGQAIPVGLPDSPGLWRWYCPANAPRPDGTIDLHVRAVTAGRLSPRLVERARVGDQIWLGPPVGRGLVPGRTGRRRDLLLIAGGTGLAPLRAIVEQIITTGPQGREVTLVVGSRTVEQCYDAVTLDTWQHAYDWLTVLPAFSAESLPVHPLERGTAIRIALRYDWPDHDILLCGPTAMIHDALPRLVVAGVPLARIHLPETYERADGAHGPESGRYRDCAAGFWSC